MNSQLNCTLTIDDFDKSRYVEYKRNVWVHKELDIDAPINHYIRAAHLYCMLKKSELCFTHRPKFSDLKEQGKKESLRHMFSCFTDAKLDKEVAKMRVDEFNKRKKSAETCIAISCWTKDFHSDRTDESYILWSWFGKDRYRIQTTIKDLLANLQVGSHELIISQVEYKKETYDATLDAQVFRKDMRYEDEQEVRFCLLNPPTKAFIPIINIKQVFHKVRASPFMDKISKQSFHNLLESKYKWINDKYEYTTILEK